MSRQFSTYVSLLLIGLTVLTGCHPIQPFYMDEDGDLSHYIDAATKLDYPDVHTAQLAEVEMAQAPRTLSNPRDMVFWDLSLEEAMATALHNSQVIRSLGGLTQVGFADARTGRLAGATTIYDAALTESQVSTTQLAIDGNGNRVVSPGALQTGQGVEAALAEFDAQFSTQFFWQKSERPQNVDPSQFGFVPQVFTEDQGNFIAALSKKNATGGVFTFRNNTIYDRNNRGFGRALPSDWFTAMEVEWRQPLLQGRGTQINRIPVVLARINTSVSLADFEAGVRNLAKDVEDAYWDLYFAYRAFEANQRGLDSALGIWRIGQARLGVNLTLQEEAQVREQFFFFRAQLESARHELHVREGRLRWLMGLTPTDHRFIRPADEPTTARVEFAWRESLAEALFRSPEIRQQKWRIKAQELQLIAAKNQLLPQLNATAMYRWLGIGDELISDDRRGLNFPTPGSTAFDVLTEGDFQESRVGLEFIPPAFGARRPLSAVRNAQLGMARAKAILEDMELQKTHALTESIETMVFFYHNAQSHFNRLVASNDEVEAAEARFRGGIDRLDPVLEAQRRQTAAFVDFYQALVAYNRAIADVHFEKGSLLDYNDVHLAEGPWPDKAYWDALGRARERDASYYLDYGYTRPSVVGAGEVPQSTEEFWQQLDGTGTPETVPPGQRQEGQPTPAGPDGESLPEPGPVAGSRRALELASDMPPVFDWGDLNLKPAPLNTINPLRQASHLEGAPAEVRTPATAKPAAAKPSGAAPGASPSGKAATPVAPSGS